MPASEADFYLAPPFLFRRQTLRHQFLARLAAHLQGEFLDPVETLSLAARLSHHLVIQFAHLAQECLALPIRACAFLLLRHPLVPPYGSQGPCRSTRPD